MLRRDFLALIGSAPLATLEALAPLSHCLDAWRVGDVFGIASQTYPPDFADALRYHAAMQALADHRDPFD